MSIGLTNVTVTVQIDLAGTPYGGSPTWTDVSSFVESAGSPIQITWGRQDWTSDVTPATCSLTLTNTDGRFTPGLTSSPYYPHVRRRARMRVSCVVAATTVFLFDGFIDSWEASFDGGVYGTCQVQATDILGRMAADMPLRPMLHEEILEDAPSFFWPMNDVGPTLGEIQTGVLAPATVVIGSGGPDAEYQTATGGADETVTGVGLGGFFSGINLGTSVIAAGFEVFFATSDVPARVELLASGTAGVGVFLETTGMIGSGGPYTDGLPHQVFVDTGSHTIYVDGVSVGSTTMTQVSSVADNLVGVVWCLACYATLPVLGRRLNHYLAASSCFAGEATDAHLARLLTYRKNTGINFPATGLGVVGVHSTDGDTLQQALYDTADVEPGLVYADGQGRVTFLNRTVLFNRSASLTLNAGAGQVAASTVFRDDIQYLVNDVTVTIPDGSSQRYFDPTSVSQDGTTATQLDLIADSGSDALQIAKWLVSYGIQEQVSATQLDVDLLTEPSATVVQGVLAVKPLDVVTVTGLPPSAPASSVTYQVQGGSITVGVEEFGVSLFTAPIWPA